MSHTNILYHTLEDPLNPKQLPGKYSDLHTLYPGRPMDSSDNPDRYNIEHEEPNKAKETFIDSKQKTAQYGKNLERNARNMGNQDKMTIHAVEDPSMLIEDPGLREANMLNPSEKPLLMPLEEENSGLRNRMPIDFKDKPLIENYNHPKTQENKPKYKWWIIILALLFLLGLFYIYTTQKVDIYSF